MICFYLSTMEKEWGPRIEIMEEADCVSLYANYPRERHEPIYSHPEMDKEVGILGFLEL